MVCYVLQSLLRFFFSLLCLLHFFLEFDVLLLQLICFTSLLVQILCLSQRIVIYEKFTILSSELFLSIFGSLQLVLKHVNLRLELQHLLFVGLLNLLEVLVLVLQLSQESSSLLGHLRMLVLLLDFLHLSVQPPDLLVLFFQLLGLFLFQSVLLITLVLHHLQFGLNLVFILYHLAHDSVVLCIFSSLGSTVLRQKFLVSLLLTSESVNLILLILDLLLMDHSLLHVSLVFLFISLSGPFQFPETIFCPVLVLLCPLQLFDLVHIHLLELLILQGQSIYILLKLSVGSFQILRLCLQVPHSTACFRNFLSSFLEFFVLVPNQILI